MEILLIEDDAEHPYLIGEMIGSQFEPGAELIHTKTLSDGILKLNAIAFDICLCDLTLADSSIEDTITQLKEIDIDTPIIVITSVDNIDYEMDLINNGIQDYLLKSELSARLLYRACIHAIGRQKSHNQIELLSTTDPLTGLFNRREFDRLLQLQMSTIARHPEPLALCLLDVDRFKQVNDEFGHQMGDLALKQVAQAMLSSKRDVDIACRLGGDEFVLLLKHCTAKESTLYAERIRSHLREYKLEAEQRPLSITLSIGSAEHQDGMTSEEFLALADKALYQSKMAGRDCIRIIASTA